MFYNVENLFDIYDDTLINDDEYLPYSLRNWDKEKYFKKVNNIYKVIMAAGSWQPPDIVGFCEVENYFVLHDLVNNTPFVKFEYGVVHYNSQDLRGIDVALIYNKKVFKPITSKSIIIQNEGGRVFSRDILYVKGISNPADTFHIFVNHWPSRRGGQINSEYKRIAAAKTLKGNIDSVLNVNRLSKIIIMGDFNDEVTDNSIANVLNVVNRSEVIKNDMIYSMYTPEKLNKTGTIKYKGEWLVYDYIFISGALLNAKDGFYVNESGYSIFSNDFLIENDDKYIGQKPFRTYVGYKYNGGFSDHLPVLLDLNYYKRRY